MTKNYPRLLSLLFSLLILYSCAESVSPELKEGVQVIRYMSAKRQIERSSFLFAFPEGKPSDFVNWMFLTLGTAEWPDSEYMAEMHPIIRVKAKIIRAPLIPKDVGIVPLTPNPEFGKQVVVKFDNDRRLLIVEGYLDSQGAPVIIRELKFPEWKPSKT